MSPKLTNKPWNSTLILLPLLTQGYIFTKGEWVILELDYISPPWKYRSTNRTWQGLMSSLLLLVGCVLPPSQLQIFWWGILTAWKKSNTFTVPAHLLVPWNQFMLLELQNPGSCNSIEGLVEYASWPNWLTYLVVIKSSMSDSDLGDWVTRWCEH